MWWLVLKIVNFIYKKKLIFSLTVNLAFYFHSFVNYQEKNKSLLFLNVYDILWRLWLGFMKECVLVETSATFKLFNKFFILNCTKDPLCSISCCKIGVECICTFFTACSVKLWNLDDVMHAFKNLRGLVI